MPGVEMNAPVQRWSGPVAGYDLAGTLDSGQAFRWSLRDGWWHGVIHGTCARVRVNASGHFELEYLGTPEKLAALRHYFQLDLDWPSVERTFPAEDKVLQTAVAQCRGLRLVRQEPWECLASFICSSTKQIVQIRQIIHELSSRHGEPLTGFDGSAHFAFPTPHRLAALTEEELRQCKLGFRAPYILGTARAVAEGRIDLEALKKLPVEAAREALIELPGVGRKIADCVLLFSLGFNEAFPIDVWIAKAMRQLYFPKRKMDGPKLIRFCARHFGPNAGYAQQFLFHAMRINAGRVGKS